MDQPAVPPREEEQGASLAVRALIVALLAAATVLVALILFGCGGGYTVTAEFQDAGQLVKGNQVKVAGAPVGSVTGLDVSDSGQAEVKLRIDDGDYKPLREGTDLVIKQTSLPGIAGRYIELQLGPQSGREIPDGGTIGTDHTQALVELDTVFNIFDPRTRQSLRDLIQGSATSIKGRGAQLQRGIHYLNPALSTGSRLFRVLSRDNQALKRFLVKSSDLVTALGNRREDLRGSVSNLAATFGALGSQQDALAESVERLPPFMRRANSTFVNLRAALDDVDPLVDAAKPVARRLGPFLTEARQFARDGRPTIRDLSRTIRATGPRNDLIEALASFPPLARAAVETTNVNGANRPGALPQTADALRAATPTLAFSRPYTADFVSWLDDFSTTGVYDALGGFSRAWLSFGEVLYGPGPKTGQFRRCPGADEPPASDGSNVFSAAEQAELNCDGSQRSVGP